MKLPFRKTRPLYDWVRDDYYKMAAALVDRTSRRAAERLRLHIRAVFRRGLPGFSMGGIVYGTSREDR